MTRGGHGYNTGIGDAVNLAWKIAAVSQGWAPAELLASYETERRPIAQQTIDLAAANMRALTIELGNAAIMDAGPDGATARAAAARAVTVAKRSEFYSLGLFLGYGYGPDSAAQTPSTDVYLPQARPGNRLPHARSADGSSLFDLLGRELTVLGPAASAQPLIDTAAGLGVLDQPRRPRAARIPCGSRSRPRPRPTGPAHRVGRPPGRVRRAPRASPTDSRGRAARVRPRTEHHHELSPGSEERTTLRIANLRGRLVLVSGPLAVDVETASGRTFRADPATVYARWDQFSAWARDHAVADDVTAVTFDQRDLGAPSRGARQVFGIGLNYADHAAEAGLPIPEQPVVFTKFASSVTGPVTEVVLPGPTVDWEAELVVVIGRGGRHIATQDAYDHVAGYTVGQDLTERTVQWQGQPAQFSIGKSFAVFAPTDPVVTTLDELPDPDRLRISCSITDHGGTCSRVQDGSTDQLIFSVPEIISRLSAVVERLPGDLIFTGTPPGVGSGMKPPRYLADGDLLVTEIEGLGRLSQRMVAASSAARPEVSDPSSTPQGSQS